MHLGLDVLKTFLHILSVTPTHMRSKDTEPEPSLNGRSLPKINCENQYIEFDDDLSLRTQFFVIFFITCWSQGAGAVRMGWVRNTDYTVTVKCRLRNTDYNCNLVLRYRVEWFCSFLDLLLIRYIVRSSLTKIGDFCHARWRKFSPSKNHRGHKK